MRLRPCLLVAAFAAMLALTACAARAPTNGAPAAPQDAPERDSDHGGGMM